MKTTLKLLFCLSLPAVLYGCSAQRGAVRGTESEALHAQAVQALENGSFIIRAEEFYFPDDKAVKLSTDGFVRVHDQQATVHYSPQLFPDTEQLRFLNVEGVAELTQVKEKRNGDKMYRLIIANGNPSWLNQDMAITLFGKTNKCFVTLGNGDMFSFTGCISYN